MTFFLIGLFFLGWQVGLMHAAYGVAKQTRKSVNFAFWPGLVSFIFLLIGAFQS